MPTPVTVTLNPGYTASDFANAIRTSLMAAGLPDWESTDTVGGIETRVLKIIYDPSKKYGTTFYWFMFSGADMYYNIATGWDTSAKVPTGTQWLDYINTLKSTTVNHMRFAVQNSSQTLTITRMTSGVRANFSLFFIKNGTTEWNFALDPTAPRADMVDLDRVCYSSLMFARTRTGSNTGLVNFQLYPVILRRHHLGSGHRAQTTASNYGISAAGACPWEIGTGANQRNPGFIYAWPGNASNDSSNQNFSAPPTVVTPVGHNANNPEYTTNYRPRFWSVRFNAYTDATLPSDFIILGTYDTITLQNAGSTTVDGITYLIISVANGATIGDSATVLVGFQTS
jgi:hypothetical protein